MSLFANRVPDEPEKQETYHSRFDEIHYEINLPTIKWKKTRILWEREEAPFAGTVLSCVLLQISLSLSLSVFPSSFLRHPPIKLALFSDCCKLLKFTLATLTPRDTRRWNRCIKLNLGTGGRVGDAGMPSRDVSLIFSINKGRRSTTERGGKGRIWDRIWDASNVTGNDWRMYSSHDSR